MKSDSIRDGLSQFMLRASRNHIAQHLLIRLLSDISYMIIMIKLAVHGRAENRSFTNFFYGIM